MFVLRKKNVLVERNGTLFGFGSKNTHTHSKHFEIANRRKKNKERCVCTVQREREKREAKITRTFQMIPLSNFHKASVVPEFAHKFGTLKITYLMIATKMPDASRQMECEQVMNCVYLFFK